MKKTEIKIVSGNVVLGTFEEAAFANMFVTSLIKEFQGQPNFAFSFIKETKEIPDPTPEEIKKKK